MKLEISNYDELLDELEEDLRGLVACDYITRQEQYDVLDDFENWAKGAKRGETYYYDDFSYTIDIDPEMLDVLDGNSINLVEARENYQDILNEYASKIYKDEDYVSPNEFLMDVASVEYFQDADFHNMLQKYFESKGKTIEETVRGYMPYKQGFLMTHGGGYAWLNSDLLGGKTSDHLMEEDFKDWVINQERYLDWIV